MKTAPSRFSTRRFGSRSDTLTNSCAWSSEPASRRSRRTGGLPLRGDLNALRIGLTNSGKKHGLHFFSVLFARFAGLARSKALSGISCHTVQDIYVSWISWQLTNKHYEN